MFKKFFHQDNIHIGITAVLLSEALCAAVLYLVTIIIGQPLEQHLSWLAAIFVPALLVVRRYMKIKSHLLTTKSAIVTLFITFVAFMFFLIKNHIILNS